MVQTKLHSPWPWFLLTAFLGLVPVLNNMHPALFFPALPPFWVEVAAVFAGIFAATMGFRRGWAILQQQDHARNLVLDVEKTHLHSEEPTPNDIVQAGRNVIRLVRNVDEDLREIGPDFTPASLKRLDRYLPVLMKEVADEEDARIRVGVVGTYLGETACRHSQWQWLFKADPSLKQFSFLVSVIVKGEKEFDPFAYAVDWMTGSYKIEEIMELTK